MSKGTYKRRGQVLTKIWGAAPEIGRQSSSVLNARRAGVKIDLPLTPAEIEAQRLVDELAAEYKDTDTRSALQKRYNICDGIAHMVPEDFYKLFRHSRDISNLKSSGVTRIKIDNYSGLQAEFVFSDIEDLSEEEKEKTHQIKPRELRMHGISGAMKGSKKAIIPRVEKGIHGVLYSTFLSPDLTYHAKVVSKGKNHSSADYLGKGNFQEIFLSAASLGTYADKFDKDGGIDLTIDNFSEQVAFPIGRIIAPKSTLATNLDLKRYRFKTIKDLIELVISNNNSDEWISEIFKREKGIIISQQVSSRPLAIFLPPDINPK